MKKEEAVAEFMKKGKLLTPAALQFLEDKDIQAFLERNYPGIILTEREFLQPNLKIIKSMKSEPEEITTEDMISFYRDMYRRMQQIIVGRIRKDFVSLNKLPNDRKEAHVIGIVREIRQQEEKFVIDLEDLTGSIPVVLDDVADLEIDDTVAIRGVAAGRVIYGKQIIYPDLPLRQPVKGSGKACFVSDLHLEEAPFSDFEKFMKWFSQQGMDYLFVAGDIGNAELFERAVENYAYAKPVIVIPGEKESVKYPAAPPAYKNRNIVSLSNPAMIELNGVKILLCHKFSQSMLKKRRLGKGGPMKEDFLALEEIPDIVHAGHTHEPHVSNYKSVTIANSGSLLTKFMPVIIDLATRDVQQAVLG